MNRREEALHLRSALRQLDYDGKMRLVAQLRHDTLALVEPLKKRIQRPLSAHIAKAYRDKGISLEWDLSRYDDAAEFRHLMKSDTDVTPQQIAAANLIFFCTRALEQGSLTDQSIDWILDAYRALDDSDVTASKRLSAVQKEKATKKRGKGEDGRTLGDLIATLARFNPDAKPHELWPPLKAMIEEWAGTCVESTLGSQQVYRYPFRDGDKTISYKQFRERLRAAKNTV